MTSSYHIDLPHQKVNSVVLWEGTADCIIDDIITSSVEAVSVIWKKGGRRLRKGSANNGYQAITFDKVSKKDEGL